MKKTIAAIMTMTTMTRQMKHVVCLTLALALLLGACGAESTTGGKVASTPEPVLPVEDPYSDWEAAPLWIHTAYSGDTGLLNAIREEGGPGTLWWVNDGAIAQAYGGEVFPDGVYLEGVFQFKFSIPKSSEELAALAGYPEDEGRRFTREWPWYTWENLARNWEFFVTIQPIQGDAWPTPSLMIPSEEWPTFEDWLGHVGDDHFGGNPALDAYHAGELLIDDPQPVSEYVMPQFAPVEGHEGYEMAVVYALPDGTPMQVRLRWRNEEGFGFWAQLPAHALETFWEYQNQWFVRVDTGEAGE